MSCIEVTDTIGSNDLYDHGALHCQLAQERHQCNIGKPDALKDGRSKSSDTNNLELLVELVVYGKDLALIKFTKSITPVIKEARYCTWSVLSLVHDGELTV